MLNFSTKQWNVAFIIAFLLHLGLFVIFTNKPTSTAKETGLHGIDIALGPAGGIPAPVVEELVEESFEEEVIEESTQEVIEEPEPEIVKEEIKPEPVPEKPVEKPIKVEKQPEVVIKKKVEETAKPVVETIAPIKQTQEKIEAQTQKTTFSGSNAQSGTKDKQEKDDGDSTSGGGIKGPDTNYVALLQSWLEKHKEYPRRARRKGQQGIVMLYFKMDRTGNVLNYQIKQSSGYSQLDDEVEAMIKRAQPLPAFPDDMKNETLELIVPVQFQLR
jgi:periplasmic protein TonB